MSTQDTRIFFVGQCSGTKNWTDETSISRADRTRTAIRKHHAKTTRAFPNICGNYHIQLKQKNGWKFKGKLGLGRQWQHVPLHCRHGDGQQNWKDGENDKKKCSILGLLFHVKLFGSEDSRIFIFFNRFVYEKYRSFWVTHASDVYVTLIPESSFWIWSMGWSLCVSSIAFVHLDRVAECCKKVSQHELQAVRAEEERRILQEELWRQQMDFREVHQQNLTEMEELRKFQSSTFDTLARRKFIEDQNTPTSSNTWRDVETFFRVAEAAEKGRHAFGTHMVYRETFLQIHFFSSLSSRIASMEIIDRRAAPFVHSGEKWKAIAKSGSEMPVWTVSQRFGHLQWRRLFRELWGRPTTIADFGSSLWQVPHTSNLCLLENKVQDRGMCLFTILYGSDALDQRSGAGWFSGWIEIFIIYSWYFNAKFWKYLMRGLLRHWTKSSIILTLKKESVWRNKRPRSRTVSFVAGRLFTWSTITFGVTGSPWFCRKLYRPIHCQSTKWRYSGIRF